MGGHTRDSVYDLCSISCNDLCLICDTIDGSNGYSYAHCSSCPTGAYLSATNACSCLESWVNIAGVCTYDGDCVPICDGCTGPTIADCSACVTNATSGTDGCACNTDWDGLDCSTYTGECSDRFCLSCATDPDTCDNNECISGAFFREGS